MFDIIIIGGGISGLHTYYKLIQQNKYNKILLLEKNDYFGGRILQIQKNINNTHYSFPAGAARFNKNHTQVIQLLKEFRLLDFRKDKPFSAAIQFIDTSQQFTNKFNNKTGYEFINKVLKLSSKFSDIQLKQLTFRELAMQVLPQKEAEFLVYASGYSGQIKNMNAFDAIHLFRSGIRVDMPYWGGKFHILIEKLVQYIHEKNGHMLLNSNVTKIKNNKNHYEIHYNSNKVLCNKIIFCIPQQNLLQMPLLKPIHCIIKDSITCKPLCRTYAIFKKEDIWFHNLNKKIVTNNQLRYIIPIDATTGIIMISYTDDMYTNYWKKIQQNQSKLKNTVVKLVNETFNISINPPEKVFVYHWNCGVAYWNKNHDSQKISQFLLNPMPNIYLCGENFSLHQSWVEGALDTSNKCIQLLK